MRKSAKRQRVAGSASFARARWFSRLSSPLVASIAAFLDVTDHLSLAKADRNTSSACRTARSWAPALDFSRAKDVGSSKWVADWNCRPQRIAVRPPRWSEEEDDTGRDLDRAWLKAIAEHARVVHVGGKGVSLLCGSMYGEIDFAVIDHEIWTAEYFPRVESLSFSHDWCCDISGCLRLPTLRALSLRPRPYAGVWFRHSDLVGIERLSLTVEGTPAGPQPDTLHKCLSHLDIRLANVPRHLSLQEAADQWFRMARLVEQQRCRVTIDLSNVGSSTAEGVLSSALRRLVSFEKLTLGVHRGSESRVWTLMHGLLSQGFVRALHAPLALLLGRAAELEAAAAEAARQDSKEGLARIELNWPSEPLWAPKFAGKGYAKLDALLGALFRLHAKGVDIRCGAGCVVRLGCVRKRAEWAAGLRQRLLGQSAAVASEPRGDDPVHAFFRRAQFECSAHFAAECPAWVKQQPQ